MPAPTPGTIIDAYRIDGTIGSGSMGDVYRAVDVGLNRKVALKLLSEKHRDNPELRARFVREGRAVAAVSHPAVVQVFATGTWDNRPYIAMELLEGTDLGSLVENNGPLDSAAAASAAFDAATGLEAAAKAGLIHRDVKPSNLVRLADGRVKVTDFGLAKPLDPGSEPALTALGVVVGTPDYIAPEQARGDAIDERVDIYALGGTIYYLLTGIPPFRTGKPGEDKYLKVVARHLKNPAPEAKVAKPSTDGELSALARKMMEKSPDSRPGYPSLLASLAQISSRLDPNSVRAAQRDRSRPITLPPPEFDQDESSSESMSGESLTGVATPARVPIWAWIFTAVCVGVFIAGMVLYATKKGGQVAAPAAVGSGSAQNIASPVMPDARTAALTPDAAQAPVVPEGMILVRKPDGSPWLFVSKRPVAVTELRRAFPQMGKPAKGEKSDDSPVTMVPYTAAKSFAATLKQRLPTEAEWDAAVATPGLVNSPTMFEWVDEKASKRVVKKPSKREERNDAPFPDVTFRTVRDL